MSEFAASRKLAHSAVGYEQPSRHSGERCGSCEHYIRATPPRCEHVKSPIRMMDWCRKYEEKK